MSRNHIVTDLQTGQQTTVPYTAQEEADADAAKTADDAAQAPLIVAAERRSNLTNDATLRQFVQTLKGFHTPIDVQAYWNGLSATQKNNAIYMLVLYIASKE